LAEDPNTVLRHGPGTSDGGGNELLLGAKGKRGGEEKQKATFCLKETWIRGGEFAKR